MANWVAGKVFAATGIVSVLVLQPFRPVVFVGESMSPTYASHEIAFSMPALGPLERGDIVVVQTDDGPMVKRVVMLEGDRMTEVWKGSEGWAETLFLDVSPQRKKHPERFREVTIPEGYVYVLGDNINGSVDSRQYGPIPRHRVVRRVLNPKPNPAFSLSNLLPAPVKP